MTEVSVLAFDPGGTTGWAAITVGISCLINIAQHPDLNVCVHQHVWRWGQIDSRHLGSTQGGAGVGRGHDALNFPGENAAVDQMMNLSIHDYPEAPVLLEKFVVDPSKVKGNFDFVTPVRIISAFSYGLHADAMSRGPFDDNGDDVVLRDPYNRFYLINRGDPKRTCHDGRLKEWGFKAVVTHENRHAADATRIAYYLLRGCRGSRYKAAEARWRAWPHVFEDPALTHPDAKAGPKRYKAVPKGERI